MGSLWGKTRRLWPAWLIEDAWNRLAHPYWRHQPPLAPRDRPAATASQSEREKLSSRRPFKRINERRVIDVLRQAGARRVLDVGCGVGNLVRHLETLGFEGHGITVNPEELTQAAHPRIRLGDIQAPIDGDAIDGAPFDAVLSFDCLEHMDSPLAALRNINRLLRNDGLFISYIPPARWTECDYHVIVYTPRQFRWLLNLAGFELEHREGRYRLTNRGATYYARKVRSDGPVYPGVLR